MTYPHYLYLSGLLRPDLQVYFNLDDYILVLARDTPRRSADFERSASGSSPTSLSASRGSGPEELQAAVPEAAARIASYLREAARRPHWRSTPGNSPHAPRRHRLAPSPAPGLHRNEMEDRLDWRLLTRLSEAMPEASIILIGRTSAQGTDAWQADYQRWPGSTQCPRPQAAEPGVDPSLQPRPIVCLIPYQTDHPFNIACCPTKILDYMVTGRPIVSTALPECQLYSSPPRGGRGY